MACSGGTCSSRKRGKKDRDKQDEFGNQQPPKDHQKHMYGNAARVRETGPPGDGIRSAAALWESGRANRTRRPGCGDRGAYMPELVSEPEMVEGGTDGK